MISIALWKVSDSKRSLSGQSFCLLQQKHLSRSTRRISMPRPGAQVIRKSSHAAPLLHVCA